MRNPIYYKSVLGLLLLSWLVSGCATTANNDVDPLEKFNRGVFAFNEGVDKVVVKPVAKTYKAIVPDPVDQGVTNFFSNIGDIVVVANDLLQFKFKQAASDAGRFFLNSTVGLLGFVDVASELGLPKHNEDFGQTLGYWGVDSGPYLVLPVLGPSSARDAFGWGADSFLDPLFYATGSPSIIDPAYLGPYAVKGVDTRADLLGAEKILGIAALDKYSYIRDAYLARREYLVYDGEPPESDEDDLFDDDDDDDDDDGDDDDDDEDDDGKGEDDEDEEDDIDDEDEEGDADEDEEGDADEDDDDGVEEDKKNKDNGDALQDDGGDEEDKGKGEDDGDEEDTGANEDKKDKDNGDTQPDDGGENDDGVDKDKKNKDNGDTQSDDGGENDGVDKDKKDKDNGDTQPDDDDEDDDDEDDDDEDDDDEDDDEDDD